MSNEDLEVTSVLDPDMIGKDVELTGQDIDFELDDSLLEDGPDEDFLDLADLETLDGEALEPPPDHEASSPASSPDDDDIDFELTEPVQEPALSDDDIDFELEVPLPEPQAVEELASEEIDFDLDRMVEESAEEIEEPIAVSEEELEEPADFELEEVVESAPQPEPEPEPEPDSVVDTGLPEVAEYTPPPQPPEEASVAALDVERIEALVEQTVRDTVTQVLERMLPGLVEEALARELEKLNQDLED